MKNTIMITSGSVLSAVFILFLTSFNDIQIKHNKTYETKGSIVNESGDSNGDTIYNTENLILVRLSEHTYQHISFLNTNDFGRVNCNGMLVLNDSQAVIFDTPADNESSVELINYVTQNLNSKIIGVIPTHFHEDCVGGLQAFNNNHIQVYASNMTIKFLKEKGNIYAGLMTGFDDSLTLSIGDKTIIAKYFGAGHTTDNIIGYFPADSVMFGGCLIKELDANKGNLADANIKDWSNTVMKIKSEYPRQRLLFRVTVNQEVQIYLIILKRYSNKKAAINRVSSQADRKPDLEFFFQFQLDTEANFLAAFTLKDPAGKEAYFEKYTKHLNDPALYMQTIVLQMHDKKIVEFISKLSQ